MLGPDASCMTASAQNLSSTQCHHLITNHSKVALMAKRTASTKLTILKGLQHVCYTMTNLTLLLRHSATNLQATAEMYNEGHSEEVDVTKAGIQITYRLQKK